MFQKVRAARLCGWALKRKNKRFPIICRTTISKKNHAIIKETVLAARNLLKVDGISLFPADFFSPAFNRGFQSSTNISINKDDIKTIASELDDLEQNYSDLFKSGFILDSASYLREKLIMHFTAEVNDNFKSHPCMVPWRSAVVESDGYVYPCFFLRQSYGSINEYPSIKALLTSERARIIRSNINPEQNEVCKRCVCYSN